MDFEEFRNTVCRSREKKTAKVRNSWGVYDAYKAIRKENWYDIGRPLKEHEFYSIIRGINKLLAEEIINGREVNFPCWMGKLELRKSPRGVSIVDGKLKNTYPINWYETMRLWFEDEEEMKKKTLLRIEDKYAFQVKYNKFKANYENKSFYDFALNRGIKKALKEKIDKGEIDTLW